MAKKEAKPKRRGMSRGASATPRNAPRTAKKKGKTNSRALIGSEKNLSDPQLDLHIEVIDDAIAAAKDGQIADAREAYQKAYKYYTSLHENDRKKIYTKLHKLHAELTRTHFAKKATKELEKEEKIENAKEGLFAQIRKKFRTRPDVLAQSLEKEEEDMRKEEDTKQSDEEEDPTTNGEEDDSSKEERAANGQKSVSNEPDSKLAKEVMLLKIEIEKIKAQQAAFSEARKTTNERFMHVAEENGSLRSNILNLEKESRDITLRVSKAIDLVEAVQPQKIYTDVKKLEARIIGIEAKIEGARTIQNKMTEQMKEMRSKLSFVDGIEKTLEINEEVREELRDIRRMEAHSKQHADKIENMFLEFKDKFSRFEKFERTARDMQEAAKSATADVEKIKSKVSAIITQSDLTSAKEEMKAQVESIQQETGQAVEVAIEGINEMKQSLAKAEEKIGALQEEYQEDALMGIRADIDMLQKAQKKKDDEKSELAQSAREAKEAAIRSAKDLKDQLDMISKSVSTYQREVLKYRSEFRKVDTQAEIIVRSIKEGKGAQQRYELLEKKLREMGDDHSQSVTLALEELSSLKKELAELYTLLSKSAHARGFKFEPSSLKEIRPQEVKKNIDVERIKRLVP